MTPHTGPVAVYDTGVILQATITPFGPAARALTLVDGQAVEAVMSNWLRSEYEQTLTRKDLQNKYEALQNERIVQAQLRRLDMLFARVDNPPQYITYDRDPKDAPIINLVIHVQADFLITRDKDMLDLNRDPTFLHLCQKTRVVDPVEFLREMERQRDLTGRDQ